MSTPVLLVGTGGLARETAEAVRAGGEGELVGWLDDDAGLWGTSLQGLPVLGPPEAAAELPGARLVLCPGSGRARSALATRLRAAGVDDERYASVVHPGVHVPASCTVGAGSVLLAGVVLTADVRLGRHVVLMPGTILTHDDELADAVTAGSRVALAGGVRVGTGAYLGAGCLVRERLSVGAWSVVGMGAVVLRDVPPEQVWVGSPAHLLRPVAAELVVVPEVGQIDPGAQQERTPTVGDAGRRQT